MKSIHLALALAGAIPFAAPVVAQDTCPMQTTQHVPESLTYGPKQECGGFSYQIGDLQIGSPRDACPLFLVYVPPHDIAVPSQQRTFVEVVGQVPITQVTFRCAREWFLFLPVGSTCVADQKLNVGSVLQLLARPCPPAT